MAKSVKYVDKDGYTLWHTPRENHEYGNNDILEIILSGELHCYTGTAYGARWCLFGRDIDEHEYKDWLIEHGMDIDNLTEEDIILIDIRWRPDGKKHSGL